MASEDANNSGGTGPLSEPNEHDYAHHTASGLALTSSSSGPPAAGAGFAAPDRFPSPAQPAASVSEELPEPAVGAEVDCPTANHGMDCSGRNNLPGTSPLLPSDPLKQSSPELSVSHWAPAPPRPGRRRFKRPEDSNCVCCKLAFERQGRSFNRRAVYTFTTPETVQWAFPGTDTHKKSFLCETCAQVIRSKCWRKNTARRSMWLKPPEKKKSDVKDAKKDRRMGKKSKAALLVSKSCYKSAFKMLWSAKGARKPMMEFLRKQLKEEMKALSRQADSPFQEKVSCKKPLSSFPWERCLSWAQEKAPLAMTCLRSLFPDVPALVKSSHQLSEEQAQTLLERRTVVTLSVPLFTRNIWKNNFLQAALGAELRLQGCSGSALDALNTLGLCQNKDTVRLRLSRLHNINQTFTQNGQPRMKTEEGQMTDNDEEDVEEEEEEEEEEEVEDAEEEEQEEEDGVQEEEEKDQAREKVEEKRRKRRAKEQRREETKSGIGKCRLKEEEEELEDDEEGSAQKKKKVVVVRLGLLKGHSEVGRSDLSAPEDSVGPSSERSRLQS